MPSTRIQTPNNKTVKKQFSGRKGKTDSTYIIKGLDIWKDGNIIIRKNDQYHPRNGPYHHF